MSIAIMTRVWSESQHKGSELLLLLAIADNANDQGVAYPAIRTIARKTRLSVRQVQRLIKVVELSGELRVSYETGPRGCNEYRIEVSRGDKMSPDEINRCHPGSKRGAIAMSPESYTEPSERKERNDVLSFSGDNPETLIRVGLTPGSRLWRTILGET